MIKKAANATDLSSVSQSIVPATDVTYSLGTGSKKWDGVLGQTYYVSNAIYNYSAGAPLTFQSQRSANNNAFLFNTTNAYTSGPMVTWTNNSVEKLNLNFAGKFTFDATNASGTPGAATIDKPSGQVAIAAGASSVVVTNSLVSATSVVLCVLQFADATLNTLRSVVPAAGSFTITGNANATAATKVGFVVFN